MNTELFVLVASSERDDAKATLDESRPAWETVECVTYAKVPQRRIGPFVMSSVPSEDDIIWTWYSDLLANDRTKRLMEREGLTGCAFDPVAFSERCRQPNERLFEMRITGFAGFAAAPHGVTVRERCDECGIYSYRFDDPFAALIDWQKWDGSDFFTIWPLPKVQICTARAAAALRRNNVSGVVAIPIEEFELVGHTAAPGLPSARLDDGQLRRLMDDPDYMYALWPRE